MSLLGTVWPEGGVSNGDGGGGDGDDGGGTHTPLASVGFMQPSSCCRVDAVTQQVKVCHSNQCVDAVVVAGVSTDSLGARGRGQSDGHTRPVEDLQQLPLSWQLFPRGGSSVATTFVSADDSLSESTRR